MDCRMTISESEGVRKRKYSRWKWVNMNERNEQISEIVFQYSIKKETVVNMIKNAREGEKRTKMIESENSKQVI